MVKSLYGLKQTCRQWQEIFLSLLLTVGYKQVTSDHSLYITHTCKSLKILAIYVDDVFLVDDDMIEFKVVKKILHKSFGITDKWPLKFFLGLEVAQTKKEIYLNQRKYCLD